MNPIVIAAGATIRRLEHLDQAEDHQTERAAAWQVAHVDQGMSYREIADAMRTELTLQGLSEAEIARAGVSHYNIGLVLRATARAATL